MFVKKIYLIAVSILLTGLSIGMIFNSIQILNLQRRMLDFNDIIKHQYRLSSDNWSYEKQE